MRRSGSFFRHGLVFKKLPFVTRAKKVLIPRESYRIDLSVSVVGWMPA